MVDLTGAQKFVGVGLGSVTTLEITVDFGSGYQPEAGDVLALAELTFEEQS